MIVAVKANPPIENSLFYKYKVIIAFARLLRHLIPGVLTCSCRNTMLPNNLMISIPLTDFVEAHQMTPFQILVLILSITLDLQVLNYTVSRRKRDKVLARPIL